MINIKELANKDIGMWVVYKSFNEKELGRIKSWNDKYIFVVYKCLMDWNDFKDYTGEATFPEDLEKIK